MVGKNKIKSTLSEVLPELLEDHGWEKQLDLYSIFEKWSQLVQEDLALHSRPLKVERGILWLEVENSSWLQQFQFDKLELLDIVNENLRLSRVLDIKMLLVKGKWSDGKTQSKDNSPQVVFEQVDEALVETFRSQVTSIEDPQCREALMQFWYLAHACRRKEE